MEEVTEPQSSPEEETSNTSPTAHVNRDYKSNHYQQNHYGHRGRGYGGWNPRYNNVVFCLHNFIYSILINHVYC